jgi:hypothetical protein
MSTVRCAEVRERRPVAAVRVAFWREKETF